MKTTIPSALVVRSAALTALLFVASPFLLARSEDDQAIRLLTEKGSVPVHAAGPYVQAGTFRVQVVVKLGQPDLKLADGTWLYHRRRIENSDAVGSLVIQFQDGRVSSLALVTPAAVAALEAGQRKSGSPELVVARR